MRFLCCLLMALLGSASFGWAAGLVIVHEPDFRFPGPPPHLPFLPPVPPRPLPPVRIVPPISMPLEVSEVRVLADVRDQIAVTTVDQEFYNPNARAVEGTFLFPVPKGAHLDKFSMEIDGKSVAAELVAADKARSIYEEIVRSLKDPALLEFAEQDLFKVRIFPIEARGRKKVKLRYTHVLAQESGVARYVVPLGTTKFSTRPPGNVTVQVNLTAGAPIKTIYSPTHRVEVNRDGDGKATVRLGADQALAGGNFELYFTREGGALGLNLLTHRTSDDEGFFLLFATPAVAARGDKVQPKDVMFVLDTSGSMAGAKLDQAKKALQFCVANLQETDRFEILRFATEVEPLFNQLRPANAAARKEAAEFLDRTRPLGGTAIHAALEKALALRPGDAARPYVVIFLTDGLPTVGVRDEGEIVSLVKTNRSGATRIFAFGIGTDVNTHLLDRVSEETRAFTQYVLPEEDIEIKVSSFFSKITEPMLTSPRLEFPEALRVTKTYPTPLPDLFKGEQLLVVGRYQRAGAGVLRLRGQVEGQERTFEYEGRFAERNSEHDFLPRLWATRRVGHLLDEIRLRGESPELREEVTSLARQYAIVTPYTAHLILEDDRARNVPLSFRYLQEAEQNDTLRLAARSRFSGLVNEQVGSLAVDGARSSQSLKQSQVPDLAVQSAAPAGAFGTADNRPALTRGTAVSGPAPLPAFGNRYVAGRSFIQTPAGFVDASIADHAAAQRLRIAFNSPEYFGFLSTNRAVLPWLAQGRNVQLWWQGKIIEVHE